MAEGDPVRLFLDELTDRAADCRIAVPDFNKTFAAWCEDEGHRALSSRAVGQRMRELGFGDVRSNGTKFWLGLGWNGAGEVAAVRAIGHDVGTQSKAPLPRDDAPDEPDVPPW